MLNPHQAAVAAAAANTYALINAAANAVTTANGFPAATTGGGSPVVTAAGRTLLPGGPIGASLGQIEVGRHRQGYSLRGQLKAWTDKRTVDYTSSQRGKAPEIFRYPAVRYKSERRSNRIGLAEKGLSRFLLPPSVALQEAEKSKYDHLNHAGHLPSARPSLL